MRFNALALLFSELESTTKRLEMIDKLSTFFENIKKSKNFEDLDKIIPDDERYCVARGRQ